MDIIAASEKLGIYQKWYHRLEGGNTFKLWIGQEIEDLDKAICKIVDKTPNSVCVFIKKKPKPKVKTKKVKVAEVVEVSIIYQDELEEDDSLASKGIDCTQWFTVDDFNKRFKI
jgi:hypothetical protein